MIERGEVRFENRMYIIDDKVAEDNSADLEYLNKEYEKLEGLLDYSLRRCYDMMKKKGLVGSEDTYDDFYERITAWYSESITNVVERGIENDGRALGSIIDKFGIKKASDLI